MEVVPSEPVAASPSPAPVESKLSKKQRREKEREERWPKKRRWADAFLQQVETTNSNGNVAPVEQVPLSKTF